jgi:hypothetical protein
VWNFSAIAAAVAAAAARGYMPAGVNEITSYEVTFSMNVKVLWIDEQ